jgi:hypothetical protein
LDWSELTQSSVKELEVLKTTINLQVPYNVGDFFYKLTKYFSPEEDLHSIDIQREFIKLQSLSSMPIYSKT